MRKTSMFIAVGVFSFGLLTQQAFAKDLDRLDKLNRLDKLDRLEERLNKIGKMAKLDEIDDMERLEAFTKELDMRIDLPTGVSVAVDVK